MSLEKHAAALYRDFEKLYRLVSLYKGNLRQIEQQVRFVENNLETHLRKPFGRQASLRFDFLMSAVFYQGEEIFRSPTPEFTLSYMLFCEGVKSIIFRGELSGQELADWVLSVRSALTGDGGGDADLASLFWKRASPNIRVSLYNSLVSNLTGSADADDLAHFDVDELEEDVDNMIEQEALSMDFSGERVRSSAVYHLEDDAWDLPSGDLVIKKLAELGLQDPEIAKKLKRELGDAQVSDRAKKILRFSRVELDYLRAELEAYDENQVEFNLMVRYLSLFESGAHKNPVLYASLVEALAGLVQSILSRFHGGLILFLLKRLESWKQKEQLQKIAGVIEGRIALALEQDKNVLQLAVAFEDSKRAKIAKDLLAYLNPKYFQSIMTHLAESKNMVAAERYLKTLVEVYPDLEQAPQLWRPDELAMAVIVLSQMQWDGRDRFLIRCLRSKDPRIAEKAGEQVALIQIDPEPAFRIFPTLDFKMQTTWLQSFIRHPVQKTWGAFMRRVLRSGIWKTADEDQVGLWIRILFKYLGKEAAEVFEPIITARRFFFWAKYPVLRSSILQVALRIDEPELKSLVRTWAQSEGALPFQDSELKSLLEARRG